MQVLIMVNRDDISDRHFSPFFLGVRVYVFLGYANKFL